MPCHSQECENNNNYTNLIALVVDASFVPQQGSLGIEGHVTTRNVADETSLVLVEIEVTFQNRFQKSCVVAIGTVQYFTTLD